MWELIFDFLIVAVAFFYSSMSVLEGKPDEVMDRVKAVCFWNYFDLRCCLILVSLRHICLRLFEIGLFTFLAL